MYYKHLHENVLAKVAHCNHYFVSLLFVLIFLLILLLLLLLLLFFNLKHKMSLF